MVSYRLASQLIASVLAFAVVGLVGASWVLHGAAPRPEIRITPQIPSTDPQRAGGLDWYALAEPSDGSITAAVYDTDGFLAFTGHPTQSSAEMWRIGAQFEWERVDTGMSFASLGDWSRRTTVLAIVRHNDFLVAVGVDGRDDDREGAAAAWWSGDGGATWQRAAIQDAADATMTAVTRGPEGWVAVGSDGYVGANGEGPASRGMAAWHSRDGQQWDRVASDSELSGTAVPMHVVPTIDSYVASGRVRHGSAHGSPLWVSRNGTTWTRVRSLPATAATVVSASDPARWVAAGISADQPGTPGFWWSADGGSWRAASVEPAPREFMTPSALGRYPGGWMALGTDRSVEGQLRIAMWMSPDTERWQEVQTPALFDGREEPTLTHGGAGVLVFGERIDEPSNSPHAFAWFAPYP